MMSYSIGGQFDWIYLLTISESEGLGMALFFLVIGVLLGSWILGFVIYTLWKIYKYHRQYNAHPILSEGFFKDKIAPATKYFAVWNYTDYAMTILFSIGTIVLAVDLFAVIRDRDEFPEYHLSYLLGGFVFTFVASVFFLIRLLCVIQILKPSRPTIKKN